MPFDRKAHKPTIQQQPAKAPKFLAMTPEETHLQTAHDFVGVLIPSLMQLCTAGIAIVSDCAAVFCEG